MGWAILHKVGILRGSVLNLYEGQCFEKLPKYDFQPDISTHDNKADLSKLGFPYRIGHTYITFTRVALRPMLSIVGRLTKYNFNSWNYRIGNLKTTSDLDLIYSTDTWYP